MPLELGVWRIDETPVPIEASGIDQEKRLEEILANDLSIASPNWMIIGRQVMTAYGNPIDILAIDKDGNLVVIELKRNRTPREVVAQLLDYASWVKDLRDDDIAMIFEKFQRQYRSGERALSVDDAFQRHFGLKHLPEELNDSHSLVVVAAELDSSTERIVRYLAEDHGVPVNAVFFRVFSDGDREYLTRAWFIDPTEADSVSRRVFPEEEWNREYYVSFGESPDQQWEDARKYGFVCASGGSWYTRTLGLLEEGGRVWVNVPGHGYVGVGTVTETVVPIREFRVRQNDGSIVPLSDVPLVAPEMFMNADDPEIAPYIVGVRWVKTIPVEDAIREKGFFGNQNTVCKPTSKRWQHTIDRLKQHFKVAP